MPAVEHSIDLGPVNLVFGTFDRDRMRRRPQPTARWVCHYVRSLSPRVPDDARAVLTIQKNYSFWGGCSVASPAVMIPQDTVRAIVRLRIYLCWLS